MNGGFVKLYRSLAEHPMWRCEPFTKGQAWIDLVMRANYRPSRVMCGTRMLEIDRGQLFTSMTALSTRWKRDRKTVRAWLSVFASDEMVDVETNSGADGGYTLLTIKNYERFQGSLDDDSPTLSATLGTPRSPTRRTSASPAHSTSVSPLLRKKRNIEEGKELKNGARAPSPEALQWLEVLNREARSSFGSTRANLRPIVLRIEDGFSVDDAKLVVATKVRQWLGTEQAQYLRPSTVFGEKFDGYLQAARRGAAGNGHINGAWQDQQTGEVDLALFAAGAAA